MVTDDTAPGDGPLRGERALIARIESIFEPPGQNDVGIGDDAAVLRERGTQVLTTDLLLEGVDFFSDAPRWFVGRKTLAASLSDLAAMGATPDAFLLTIGFGPEEESRLDELLEGMASLARSFRIRLVGGDLSRASSLILSVTAIGRLDGRSPLLRSAASPGESIFVSRPLGGAAAGLELVRRGWKLSRHGTAESPTRAGYEIRELGASLLRAQLDPSPECALGSRLASVGGIGACIDVSDGLSTDLARICEASGVGALLEWERIPIVPDLERLAIPLGLDPARCALHGGEELALLFSARGGEARLSSLLGRPVYRIGKVEAEPGVRLLRGGAISALPPAGFDHFG